jgi:Tol biopolymer transport system component
MTHQDRVERLVSEWLEDAARPRTPDYFPEILAATARTRQRAAWTFPERWLPMIVARQRIAAPALPWRVLALALLLIALVVAGLIVAGSRSRLPAPFGPAANGHIAYSANGDIYTADPATGVSRAIVTGPDVDVAPRWSRDGTRIVFERKEPGVNLSGPGRLFVVDADGTHLTLITPEPLTQIDGHRYTFSPDGAEVMLGWNDAGRQRIAFARTDGNGIRQLTLGMAAAGAVYRPPLGREIAFVGLPEVGNPLFNGLYAINVDGTGLRTIVAPTTARDLDSPEYSPDGSLIAYMSWSTTANAWTVRAHLIAPDATGDREVTTGRGSFEGVPLWSNDGKRLLLLRGYVDGPGPIFGAIVPIDAPTTGVETDRPLIVGQCCTSQEWSPDDSMILATPIDMSYLPAQQLAWDARTGHVTEARWPALSEPTWQRRSP